MFNKLVTGETMETMNTKIRRATQILRESAKMHRLKDCRGHGAACDTAANSLQDASDTANELLSALERWEDFMLTNYSPEDIAWWQETRTAIAKAKGE